MPHSSYDFQHNRIGILSISASVKSRDYQFNGADSEASHAGRATKRQIARNRYRSTGATLRKKKKKKSAPELQRRAAAAE